MDERPVTGLSADAALQRLRDGNARFLGGATRPCRRRSSHRLADHQEPYATILGCSDSRVPPELIFDAGLGELFVVWVAGNVYSPEVSGSLQYAGVHLNTRLFVVLGHEGCGAVKAAPEARLHGVVQRTRIQRLVETSCPLCATSFPTTFCPCSSRAPSRATCGGRWPRSSSRPRAGWP
jgi:carbonic anhydrase